MRHGLTIAFIALHAIAYPQTRSSGGLLSSDQSAVDIKHYLLDLRIDPYKKVISGTATVQFQLLKPSDKIVLDLV